VDVSKENAAEAAECFERVLDGFDLHLPPARRDVDFLRAFLEAARRKLPSDAPSK
jgi:hypothetical protein